MTTAGVCVLVPKKTPKGTLTEKGGGGASACSIVSTRPPAPLKIGVTDVIVKDR